MPFTASPVAVPKTHIGRGHHPLPESWLAAVGLGLLLPLLAYLVLPWMGIHLFERLFSISRVVALVCLVVGSAFYLLYFQWVLSKPGVLVYFIGILWPFVEYANNILLIYMGINLHLRPLLLLLLGFPALVYGLRYVGPLLKNQPHLKFYLAFWLIVVIYFFGYNSFAVDPSSGHENVLSEGSVGVIQLTAYSFCLVSLVVSGTLVLTQQQRLPAFFDRFNTFLLLASTTVAVLTVLGYPFNLFSTQLDGFHRAMGIFTHPNPFAHHMGILLVYLLGLLFYYQGGNKHRIPAWLLTGGLLVNMLAFLLGLSKTAISVFLVSAFVLVLFNLASPQARRNLLKGVCIVAVVAGLGMGLYQLITENSFFDILQARIEQRQSFNWRVEIWGVLMSHLDYVSIWFGHGFTAANLQVFQYSFHDRLNPHPLMMVHNGYVALLYDFGIWGYTLFLAVLSLMGYVFRRVFHPAQAEVRALLATVMAMAVYFLLTCGFDEMTYMFDAPLLFWTFSTLIVGVCRQEAGA